MATNILTGFSEPRPLARSDVYSGQGLARSSDNTGLASEKRKSLLTELLVTSRPAVPLPACDSDDCDYYSSDDDYLDSDDTCCSSYTESKPIDIHVSRSARKKLAQTARDLVHQAQTREDMRLVYQYWAERFGGADKAGSGADRRTQGRRMNVVA